MIRGANVSRVLARTGVDWVLVDCEHGDIDGMKLFFFRDSGVADEHCRRGNA